MSRLESRIIGLFIGIMCPVSLFVLFWWTTAALTIYHILLISESGITIAAFTGLIIGIIFDVFHLKKWIIRFYNANMKLMVLAYLLWSIMAVALFMGLPFGNIVLGTLAGLYVGRKQYHARAITEIFARSIRNVSIFTALVTGAEALLIGILARGEPIIVEILQALWGLNQFATTGLNWVSLVTIGCLALSFIQFLCTRTAATLAFKLGK